MIANKDDPWADVEEVHRDSMPTISSQMMSDTSNEYNSEDPWGDVAQVGQLESFQSEPFEPIKQEPSTAQSVAQSVPVQAGLGLAKFYTWPADLYKAWTKAEAMQSLEELEEKGIPVDREKYLQAVESASELVPTQEMGEKIFSKLTGVSLQPKEGSAGKFAREASEFINPRGMVKAGLKTIVKKIGGGVAGEAIKEGLESVGVNPLFSTAIGSLASGGISHQKVEKLLSSEAKDLERISEKHGLRKLEGMFQERTSLTTPSATEKNIEKAKKSLSETSKKALDQVIEKKIPLAAAIKNGANIKEMYNKAYDLAYEKASHSKIPVSLSPVVKWIDERIASIESKVPSPSKSQEKIIDILKDERRKLSGKKITATQALDQYQSYNENLRGLYRKPELAGMEEAITEIYGDLNKELSKSIKNSGNTEVSHVFGIANNIYAQNSKIDQTYSILKNSLEDPTKLKKVLQSKKGNFLERNLGKDGVKDLEEISLYSQKAKEKVFDKVKEVPGFLESMKGWGKVASYIAAGKLGLLASSALEGYQRLQGHIIMKDSSRKSYANLMKAISSGSESAIKKYAAQLDKSIENEYGSVDNFLDSI